MMVDREDAKRELLDRSRLNVIQVEKLLGTSASVERSLVDAALDISRESEKAAKDSNS